MLNIEGARVGAEHFLQATSIGLDGAKLTPNAEPSLFALCFRVFLSHLLLRHELISANDVSAKLCEGLRQLRSKDVITPVAKPYRQLLAFSLSALSILRTLSNDPLEDLVIEQLSEPLEQQLSHSCCLDGRAGSGNQAMFLAIFLIHARDFLGKNTQTEIDRWVSLHLEHMNRFGFWGPGRGMTHLQFQNGYHQHEVFEYLGITNPCLNSTLMAVRGLADEEGHFAPYPGGGGCYDYDAVFMLTPHGHIRDDATRLLLIKTAETLISEQLDDGGFAESLYIRPRSLSNNLRSLRHVLSALGNGPLFKERLRYGLALQRSKHDRIHTHWSQYSRRWNESDLWDTWFRLLAIARIDLALYPEHSDRWGFINYPGIGYHATVKTTKFVQTKPQ